MVPTVIGVWHEINSLVLRLYIQRKASREHIACARGGNPHDSRNRVARMPQIAEVQASPDKIPDIIARLLPAA
ncbi:MAG: hypothetical protein ACTXOO_01650 [Sodalis sp. (in: enterobacteria)]